jgi:HEXXH motif-containing protein
MIAPDHADRRFPSPLKPEPRPLRGVMLAYHALAYITELYDAVRELDVIADEEAFELQLVELRTAAMDAEATCMSARPFLTERGQQFLDHTANWVFRDASSR